MHVIYKITYIPHLSTNYPKYYIGSKYNWCGKYFGSVAANSAYDFTDGVSLQAWWKSRNKSDFKFEILQYFDEISKEKLLEFELCVQINLDISSDEYFNSAYAVTGWYAKQRTQETKKKQSKSTESFWNSPEGEQKRLRLIERNKTKHSSAMIQRWKNPTQAMLDIKRGHPCSEETKEILRKSKLKAIEYKGTIYNGWDELLMKTGVTKFLYKKYYINGFDPEPNIGIKDHKKLRYIKIENMCSD